MHTRCLFGRKLGFVEGTFRNNFGILLLQSNGNKQKQNRSDNGGRAAPARESASARRNRSDHPRAAQSNEPLLCALVYTLPLRQSASGELFLGTAKMDLTCLYLLADAHAASVECI